MSTLYSDVPYNLEKGSSESFHPESCPAQPPSRRSFVKHPWIVVGTAALTWLVFSCAKRAFGPPHHVWQWAGEVEQAPPAEEDLAHCVSSTNWTSYYDQPPWTSDYPYGAETTLSLPLDSDALRLLSRGPFQHGVVNIEQSSEAADTVNVRVRVAYHDDEALKRATVCSMARAGREHGVGIFTHPIRPRPNHRDPLDEHLEFDVTLVLPAGNEAPLSVKKLETKMPNYSQNVADLQKSVLFDRISLTSTNGVLSVQSVAFESGHFSSVNGEIDGHFIAQSSLSLHTVNGRIAPTVNLLHRDSTDPARLRLHSVNGEIDAEVSLTSEASTGGEFKVAARSTNGKIGLKFTDTPVDSVLWCRAETTVGEVEVELDSAYEGTYSLQSVLGKKFVSQREVEDPSGQRRERVVSRKESFGRVGGDVEWVAHGSSFDHEGHVVLKSVVSPLTLVI